MKKNSAMIILCILLAFSSGFSAGRVKKQRQENGSNKQNHYIPHQVVVKFKEVRSLRKTTTGLSSIDRILRKFNVTDIQPLWKNRNALKKLHATSSLEKIYFIHFAGDQSPKKVAEQLNRDPNIEYAEPLYLYRINVEPNDRYFPNQNYLQAISAPAAWDVVKGEQGDVVIAVVDGGTDINHPDLQDNLWVNPDEIPDNGIDDDNDGFVDDVHGWNFANQSNDPTGLSSTPINADHGTLTAGIAAAVTNNGKGVAGVSWNAKLMAIDAGSASSDTSIAFGFQGILYAAVKKADIISLSWGSYHSSSQFEADIIKTATETGCAVVAAAGNDNSDSLFYPAAYDHVLSVAAISNGGVKANFSNYGRTIDVAAPGLAIYNTLNDGTYGAASGTSFSAPIAAGLLALIKTEHPAWSGIQTAEQARVTADNIDDLNPNYVNQLGNGKINAFRAVTDSTFPSIRISSLSILDENGDGIIEPGERVDVMITFFNYLGPVNNVSVRLLDNDSYINLLTEYSSIAAIGTLQEATLSTPLSFRVPENTPRNHHILFTVEFSENHYRDSDKFQLTVLPDFVNTTENKISTTITNKGRIGFADTDNQADGIGFHFNNGPNLLFEGAIIAGTGSKHIIDAARGDLQNGKLQYHEDFQVTTDGDIRIFPGSVSDRESMTIFDDGNAASPLNLLIKQETFTWRSPPYDDLIIFRYRIDNLNGTDLKNFHFGLFFDWDMDSNSFATNKVSYDINRKMSYAYDISDNGPNTYVGVALLSGGKVSSRAIFNDQSKAGPDSWGIYDGFTNTEKWQAISGGLEHIEAGPADISHVIASGPHIIKSNRAIEVGFALVAGDNQAQMNAAIDSAKNLWKHAIPSGLQFKPPEKFELTQNYPNPFTPSESSTTIRYGIVNEGNVELAIFNVLGQRVKTLVKKTQPPNFYLLDWDGSDQSGKLLPSGIYFYRLKAGNFSKAKKILLVR